MQRLGLGSNFFWTRRHVHHGGKVWACLPAIVGAWCSNRFSILCLNGVLGLSNLHLPIHSYPIDAIDGFNDWTMVIRTPYSCHSGAPLNHKGFHLPRDDGVVAEIGRDHVLGWRWCYGWIRPDWVFQWSRTDCKASPLLRLHISRLRHKLRWSTRWRIKTYWSSTEISLWYEWGSRLPVSWLRFRIPAENVLLIEFIWYFLGPVGIHETDPIKNVSFFRVFGNHRLSIIMILHGKWASLVATFAVVCSSFSAVNLGTSLRSLLTPYGDCTNTTVIRGNRMVSRTVFWGMPLNSSDKGYWFN